jgi:hypothetical protein
MLLITCKTSCERRLSVGMRQSSDECREGKNLMKCHGVRHPIGVSLIFILWPDLNENDWIAWTVSAEKKDG